MRWSDHSVIGHRYRKAINTSFLDMMATVGIDQIVNFPTRGDNTLDLFLTNRPSLVNRCEPVPGLSDHEIVFVESDAQATRVKPVRRRIHLWNKANVSDVRNSVQKFSDNFIRKHNVQTPVDILWEEIKEQHDQVMEQLVPSKMSSTRFSQPWINTKVKRLARRKKCAYQKAKLSKCKKDWTRYKNLKKLCQANCRKTYNEFVNDMIANKSKKFWTFVKSKRNDNTGVAPLKKNGIIYSDSKTKAEVLNQQFASVFTDDGDRKLPDKGNSTYPSLPNIQVRVDGVVKLLRNLNPHKAGGPDNIRPKFLREVAEELAPALTLLFQASLDQGQIPSDWKEGLVTPIFKKGERSKASNYRPISLTSICCKVLEHIVHSNVMTHLDKFAILSDAQHGFRKRRSCESQLVTTIQDLAKGLDDKQQLDAVLLDFSKAFDKVSHKRLILKLHHYGIRGQVLRWIEAFLSDRTQ